MPTRPVPGADTGSWDDEADVAVVGFGVAGVAEQGGVAVRRPRAVVAVVATAALVAALTQTLVVPALPLLPGLLDASPGAVSWVVTAIVVASAAAHPVLGRLADQFGSRRVLLCTMSAFVVGSLACALTREVAVVIAGRVLQGAATASIPIGISLLSALLSSQRRAVAVALVSVMLGFGGSLGLTLSGFVVALWGLPGLFLVPAAAGLAVLVGLLTVVPSPPRADAGSRVDPAGGLLLVATLVLVLLPVSRGTAWGWTSPLTLGLFAAGAVVAVVFVAVQLRRSAPMVDLRLAVARPTLLTNLACVAVGVAMFTNFLGTTAVLQAPTESGYGFGFSMVGAGLAMLPGGVLMIGVAVLSARTVVRFGGRATLIAGMVLIGMGFVPRLLVHDQVWQVIGSAALVSAGTAAVFAAVPALIIDTTPRTRTAAANGLNALSRSVGLALAGALFGTLSGLGGPGLVLFFDIGGACILLGLLAALAVPRPARGVAPSASGAGSA